jgi:xylitol oxidase
LHITVIIVGFTTAIFGFQPETANQEMLDTRGDCKGYEQLLEKNWNGNVTFHASVTIVPQSVEELCDAVRDAAPPIRVIGRGHSFTPLAECSGGTLLSLSNLNQVLDFCPPSTTESGGKLLGSITIQGGTTYTEVAQFLGKRGALQNLPSCSQFTVAGAIATATHGSGVNIPNLSAQVSMLEFVQADGSLVRYSRDDESRDILVGCRVHLGCLGIVSRLTLDVVPYYEVETCRYDDVPLQNMLDNLPQLWKSCDSLSVWTSGFGHGHGTGSCWMAFRHFLGAPSEESTEPTTSTVTPVHTPLSEEILGDGGTLCERTINRYCAGVDDPVDFTPTGTGPWYDALTVTLREGKETNMTTVDIQAEFFVPLEHAQEAIRAVWEVSREWSFSSPWGYSGASPTRGLIDAMEFRQVKGGDGAWLSPHSVDSLGLHTSFNGDPAYRANIYEIYVPALERALEPFGVRAHWGKLAPRSFAATRINELYEEDIQRFRDLCAVHDPVGKFRNAHVNRMLFGQ